MTPYELFAGALTLLGGASVVFAGYAKHRFDKRFVAELSNAKPGSDIARTDEAAVAAIQSTFAEERATRTKRRTAEPS